MWLPPRTTLLQPNDDSRISELQRTTPPWKVGVVIKSFEQWLATATHYKPTKEELDRWVNSIPKKVR